MGRDWAITPVSILLAVVVLMCSASVDAAAPQLQPLGKISLPLSHAAGLGIDNAGNLFLAETRQRTISKYDTFGRKLKSFSAFPHGKGGIAVSPLGDSVYVVCGQQVAILNADSGAAAGWLALPDRGFQQLAAIDIDALGRIFVADRGAGTVSIFNAKGEYQTDLSAPYAGHLFANLHEVAVNRTAQELWVVDEGEDGVKILVFDLAGGFLRELTAADFGSEPIGRFCALCFDTQGRVYILDSVNKEVRSFDFQTMQSGRFTGPPLAEKSFEGGIAAMVFDPVTNRLYVSCGSDVFILGVDRRERLLPLSWQ